MKTATRTKRLLSLMTTFALATASAACSSTDTPAAGDEVDGGGGGSEDSSGQVDAGTDAGSDDVGEPDAGEGDAGEPDVGEPDAGEPDVPEDTGSDDCPGGDGCDCDASEDCFSGLCLDTPVGKKCATPCVNSCEDGDFTCTEVELTAGDTGFFCVPNKLTLCAPCGADSECQINGTDAACVSYGDDGNFCGASCNEDADCGDGYACNEVTSVGGKTSKQCVLADEAATCECSEYAIAQGMKTTCNVSNDFGSCSAERACTADGLEACAATTPAEEVCDAEDNDCDGNVDNLSATATCAVEAFFNAGSKAACVSDADCAVEGESCDEKNGECRELIGSCSGVPICQNGKEICTNADTPKAELCNGEDDDCDGVIDEDFPVVDLATGATLLVGDACGTGPCANGKVICESFAKAVCNSLDKATPETCDDVDNDCNGQVDDMACDDNDACTTDVCDGAAKACTNTPAVDCDDGDQCTTDTCDAATGQCGSEPFQGACDDGNACTVGDACGNDPGDGSWICLPGADPQICDDGNPCTDDACDTQQGCIAVNNAAAVPCYSGPQGTENVGMCIGGQQFCKDGALDPVCVDEVLPSQLEACDGKDDNCDGVTDEGCKPTDVAVTFSSAYISGQSGQMNVQVLVGPSGPVGKATGQKYEIDFGFLAWLTSLFK